MIRKIAVLLYDGVEVLDCAGPAEVFASASRYGAKGRENTFRVYTVSKSKAPVDSQGFLDVVPDYSIEDSPRPDILILPGGGPESVVQDAAWRRAGRPSRNPVLMTQ